MTTARKHLKARLRIVIRYGILSFFAVLFVVPVWFMLMSSTKPYLQLMRDTSSYHALLPGDFFNDSGKFVLVNNYTAVFDRIPLDHFIFNSMLVTLVTLVLALIVNSMAAFSFTFLRWWGKEIILSVIIATFVVPFETVAIPLLLVVNELPWISRSGITTGWLDSYHVQIIPFIADPLSIFLFYQFFKEMPWELVEAARLDGASWFQIYFRIIVPISGPVFAVVAILKFLLMYNQYLWPVLTVRSEKYRPVMIGVEYVRSTPEVMAYLTVITVPVLIFYFLMQQAFIKSTATSTMRA